MGRSFGLSHAGGLDGHFHLPAGPKVCLAARSDNDLGRSDAGFLAYVLFPYDRFHSVVIFPGGPLDVDGRVSKGE